jgi:catechol 2,3-dioxygenase-like lactoylglutathione lyase family enzyme
METELLGIRHVAFPTRDLPAAIVFYREVLGFLPYHLGDADWAMLTLGDTTLSLIKASATPMTGAGGAHHAHVGLNAPTPDSVDQWYRKLSALLPAVGRPTKHRDGSYGFYFRDRDGNPLELIFIPKRSLAAKPLGEAWVLLARESRDPHWKESLAPLPEQLRLHLPGLRCAVAYLKGDSPSLEELMVQWKTAGLPPRVRIFPLFLGCGASTARDLTSKIQALATAFPDTEFRPQAAIGESIRVREALVAAMVAVGCAEGGA